MKKAIFICSLIIFSGLVLYSCKPNDEKLQKDVSAVLLTAQPEIEVASSVKDGVATLTGTVESEDAKAEVEKLVKSVKDIKSVVNNVEVKLPPPPAPVLSADDTLKATITTALTAGGFNDVTVDVKDGEVTLKGSAKKSDFKQIMQIANESKPKKVVNQITVKK